LRWTPVVTHEMERAAYRINDTDRCYHCKAELMDVVGPIAAASGATVAARTSAGSMFRMTPTISGNMGTKELPQSPPVIET